MRIPLQIALLSSLLLLPACKRHYEIETNAPATAGTADITLSRDKTGNGNISVSFEHLAAPKDIDPSLSAYVVWAQVEGKDPYKLGIVNYKEKKRSGDLSATYSESQFTLIVTVEKDPGVGAPVGAKIVELPVVAPKK